MYIKYRKKPKDKYILFVFAYDQFREGFSYLFYYDDKLTRVAKSFIQQATNGTIMRYKSTQIYRNKSYHSQSLVISKPALGKVY